ncbi:MAG: hypothetical protein Q7S27_01660 [Nanoarchaeota archaeon]|nr:hypothetical protein [Nanoarchaeota archaeon]
MITSNNSKIIGWFFVILPVLLFFTARKTFLDIFSDFKSNYVAFIVLIFFVLLGILYLMAGYGKKENNFVSWSVYMLIPTIIIEPFVVLAAIGGGAKFLGIRIGYYPVFFILISFILLVIGLVAKSNKN